MLNYDEIHDSYYQKVKQYLSSIVGQDDAEDISQEVFIKINRSLDSLQDESKLSFWIYRIALNAARDHLRKKKSKIPVVSLDALSSTIEAGCHSRPKEFADTRVKAPDEKHIKDEMTQCYIDFIEKLPEKYYEIYVLNEIEHLTNQEIADKLSISLDTVKIRIHRARNMLHEMLRENCSCYSDKDGSIMCEPK